MTHHSEQASANASTTHPTTKSHCPAGAGIINQPAAPEGSHTPPQACATPAIDPACQPHSEAPHAQLVEGYRHEVEDDADMHIDPEDRADIERQHQAMCDLFSNLQDAILDGLIPFQDHAYRAGYKRATQHHAATASACATANEYCQEHRIGEWGGSAVRGLIAHHKRLREQLAHSHKQEQRLDDEITELRAAKFKSFTGEECWIWQGDESDNLAMLVVPVVIWPTDLQEIIRQRDEAMQLATEAQQHTATQLTDQADKITVTRSALKEVLTCLISEPMFVRELQATRLPPDLFPDNPINKLLAEFEGSPATEEGR